MDQEAIIQYIMDTYMGVEVVRPADGPGAGDTFIFYNPQRDLDQERRWPFATIVTKDYGDFDNASLLDRPGVFRLNIGVSREAFKELIGQAPGDLRDQRSTYDYAALDRLLPHPVYAAQSWVCVLNPSARTFEALKLLLADAYRRVATRQARRPAPPD